MGKILADKRRGKIALAVFAPLLAAVVVLTGILSLLPALTAGPVTVADVIWNYPTAYEEDEVAQYGQEGRVTSMSAWTSWALDHPGTDPILFTPGTSGTDPRLPDDDVIYTPTGIGGYAPVYGHGTKTQDLLPRDKNRGERHVVKSDWRDENNFAVLAPDNQFAVADPATGNLKWPDVYRNLKFYGYDKTAGTFDFWYAEALLRCVEVTFDIIPDDMDYTRKWAVGTFINGAMSSISSKYTGYAIVISCPGSNDPNIPAPAKMELVWIDGWKPDDEYFDVRGEFVKKCVPVMTIATGITGAPDQVYRFQMLRNTTTGQFKLFMAAPLSGKAQLIVDMQNPKNLNKSGNITPNSYCGFGAFTGYYTGPAPAVLSIMKFERIRFLRESTMKPVTTHATVKFLDVSNRSNVIATEQTKPILSSINAMFLSGGTFNDNVNWGVSGDRYRITPPKTITDGGDVWNYVGSNRHPTYPDPQIPLDMLTYGAVPDDNITELYYKKEVPPEPPEPPGPGDPPLPPDPFTLSKDAAGGNGALLNPVEINAGSTIDYTLNLTNPRAAQNAPAQPGDPGEPEGLVFTEIWAGNNHEAIAKGSDGKFYSWGRNNLGQLGLGDTTDRDTPTEITGLNGKNITEIHAGNYFFVAKGADGKFYGWGANDVGQLGLGGAMTRYTPSEITGLNGKSITDIWVGNNFTFAKGADGKFYSWGSNNNGQLGLGDSGSATHRYTPTEVTALSDKNITDIWAPDSFVIAKGIDGKLYSWGRNSAGQLGLGDMTARNTPTEITNLNGLNITDIWISISTQPSVVAKGADGKFYGWGSNFFSEMGQGFNLTAPTSYLEPIEITGLNGKNIEEVYPGRGCFIAKGTNGKFYGWGRNNNGQLGLGPSALSTIYEPTEITGLNGLNISKIYPVLGTASSSCYGSFFAQSTDGTFYSWGYNGQGQLALGDTANRNTPTEVPALNGKNITELYALESQNNVASVFAKGADGKAYVWGYNLYGQLGLGDTTDRTTPTLNPNFSFDAGVFTDIWQGGSYSTIAFNIAKAANGKFYAWGSNNNGQLGLGDTVDRDVPTEITALNGKNITDILISVRSVFAKGADGKFYGWGQNINSQLALGDTVNRDVPTEITALNGKNITGFRLVGSSGVFAKGADGKWYGWGFNSSGSLALGDTTRRSLPEQITAFNGLGIVEVVASEYSGIAKGNNGKWYGWGRNDNGHLGLGDNTNRAWPTEITGLNGLNITDLYFSGSNSTELSVFAKGLDGKVYAWGYNSSLGDLGLGDDLGRNIPTQITGVLLGKNISELFMGQYIYTKIAKDADGKFYTWGPYTASVGWGARLLPEELTSGWSGKGISDIYLNSDANIYNAAIMAKNTNGQLFSMGRGTVLGLGGGSALSTLTQISALDGKFITDLWSRNGSSIAKDAEGRYYSWGYNGAGQLGLGDTADRNTPTEITELPVLTYTSDSGPADTRLVFEQIWKSDYRRSFIAKATDGKYYGWGYGGGYYLGNNDTSDQLTPVHIPSLDGKDIAKIVFGNKTTFAVGTDGKLYSAGNTANSTGRNAVHATFIEVGQSGNNLNGKAVTDVWIAIAPTSLDDSVIVKTSTGDFYVWGSTIALLGMGIVSAVTPALNNNLNGITEIYPCGHAFIAKDAAGKLYVWGYNAMGELGRNGPIDLSFTEVTPFELTSFGFAGNLLNGKTVTDVWTAPGYGVTGGTVMVKTTENKIYSWGRGATGITGFGDTTNLAAPKEVTTLSGKNITDVWFGYGHGIARGDDGKFYSWGNNNMGQLGRGSVPSGSLPGEIDTMDDLGVTDVYMGDNFTIVKAAGGKFYGWGQNDVYNLGMNSTTNLYSPTELGLLQSRGIIDLWISGNGVVSQAASGDVWVWGESGNGAFGEGSSNTTLQKPTLNATYRFEPNYSAYYFIVTDLLPENMTLQMDGDDPWYSISGVDPSALGELYAIKTTEKGQERITFYFTALPSATVKFNFKAEASTGAFFNGHDPSEVQFKMLWASDPADQVTDTSNGTYHATGIKTVTEKYRDLAHPDTTMLYPDTETGVVPPAVYNGTGRNVGLTGWVYCGYRLFDGETPIDSYTPGAPPSAWDVASLTDPVVVYYYQCIPKIRINCVNEANPSDILYTGTATASLGADWNLTVTYISFIQSGLTVTGKGSLDGDWTYFNEYSKGVGARVPGEPPAPVFTASQIQGAVGQPELVLTLYFTDNAVRIEYREYKTTYTERQNSMFLFYECECQDHNDGRNSSYNLLLANGAPFDVSSCPEAANAITNLSAMPYKITNFGGNTGYKEFAGWSDDGGVTVKTTEPPNPALPSYASVLRPGKTVILYYETGDTFMVTEEYHLMDSTPLLPPKPSPDDLKTGRDYFDPTGPEAISGYNYAGYKLGSDTAPLIQGLPGRWYEDMTIIYCYEARMPTDPNVNKGASPGPGTEQEPWPVYVGNTITYTITVEDLPNLDPELFPQKNEAYEYTVPASGTYKLETWGAQGGNYSTTYQGGKGGYSYGEIYLEKDDTLYIYVGSQAGYNGGGSSIADPNLTGGGATDIRKGGTALSDRILVAGGGGGAGHNANGGAGGGTSATAGANGGNSTGGAGGTQLAHSNTPSANTTNGALGTGGSSTYTLTNNRASGSGGGGYYGGNPGTQPGGGNGVGSGGGGGSGYISASLTSANTYATGASGYVASPGGTNGYAKITPVDVELSLSIYDTLPAGLEYLSSSITPDNEDEVLTQIAYAKANDMFIGETDLVWTVPFDGQQASVSVEITAKVVDYGKVFENTAMAAYNGKNFWSNTTWHSEATPGGIVTVTQRYLELGTEAMLSPPIVDGLQKGAALLGTFFTKKTITLCDYAGYSVGGAEMAEGMPPAMEINEDTEIIYYYNALTGGPIFPMVGGIGAAVPIAAGTLLMLLSCAGAAAYKRRRRRPAGL
ncbi:MAG: glycine-rich protein [Oscillospiraceae bacterium]|nr:glycine-rich protein [Oscillospiraceae bacterium]